MKKSSKIRTRFSALVNETLPALLRRLHEDVSAMFSLAPAPVPVRIREKNRR